MTLVSAALEAPPRNDSAGSAPALWEACTDQLSREIPEQQFNTWIRPLSARLADDGARLTLHVANRFKLDWVRAQYARRICAILEQLEGRPIVVELAITPRTSTEKKGSTQAEPAASAAVAQAESPAATRPADDADPGGYRNRLNGALTFETLVEGSANRMARAAALHVAGAPGQLYNPLFIYGGVGLGKTHLVHAVGNRLLQ
ncbi:DnaA/Hda family protein, partial [Ottowia sp.]|uniref:DnaA ATPase domain-containing protein n=1 Tax=Ottowia sp. TaxID=1898956 RepID=UPI002623930B